MFISRKTYEKLTQSAQDSRDHVLLLKAELKDEKHNFNKTVEKYEEKINEVLAKNSVLEQNKEDQRELYRREAELDTREEVLDATAKRYADIDGMVTKAEESKTELGEAKYKAGYADGLADGLRKATEITKEDRENMAKIAMVVAASHSSEGVQKTFADASVGAKALSDGTSSDE